MASNATRVFCCAGIAVVHDNPAVCHHNIFSPTFVNFLETAADPTSILLLHNRDKERVLGSCGTITKVMTKSSPTSPGQLRFFVCAQVGNDLRWISFQSPENDPLIAKFTKTDIVANLACKSHGQTAFVEIWEDVSKTSRYHERVADAELHAKVTDNGDRVRVQPALIFREE
ncbi:hypothetical protein ACEPPN_014130 [Leptodophora sp. 'Broadleaf-Isolate-01']